jgi:hypothetical protein
MINKEVKHNPNIEKSKPLKEKCAASLAQIYVSRLIRKIWVIKICCNKIKINKIILIPD